MKVITFKGTEFLSTENTLELLGERGGVYFCSYYTPKDYYQSAMFASDGTCLDDSGIKLYNVKALIELS